MRLRHYTVVDAVTNEKSRTPFGSTAQSALSRMHRSLMQGHQPTLLERESMCDCPLALDGQY
jgi:hypothetical protein